MQVERSIKVRIMDREYPLRVGEADAEATREMAALLDHRIQAFRRSHPDQPELTSAVMAALSITDELFAMRQRYDSTAKEFEGELTEMVGLLEAALKNGVTVRE